MIDAAPNGNGAATLSQNNDASLTQEFRQLQEFVVNAITLREELNTRLADPRRDIETECGHPAPSATIDPELYQQLYDREPIANRIVTIYPAECWQDQPTVYEDEDAEVVTPFEAAWDALGKQLYGEASYHREEAGSAIWPYLKRADKQSRIGHYGVILIGIDDGKDMREPAWKLALPDSSGLGTEEQYYHPGVASTPAPKGSKKEGELRKLLYLRVFPESLAPITQFEGNPANPRFGQPVMYSVTFNDPSGPGSGAGLSMTTRMVHWTRVVHLADTLEANEVFAVPAMQPNLNRLLDLKKLYAGSAEMYFKGAFPGIVISTHPQLGGDVEVNATNLRTMMTNYQNKLQRYLALTGMSAHSLSPQVVSPTSQIDAHIEAICIQLGIPKRIFMGTERGELASSQDAGAWQARCYERKLNYLTPRVIIPFVNRLITLGVLPEPEQFIVEWPNPNEASQGDKIALGKETIGVLREYVQGNIEHMVPPMDFLTRIVGWSEEEAGAVLENALAYQQDAEAVALRVDLRPANPEAGLIALLRERAKGLIDDETLKAIIMLLFQISEVQASQIKIDEAGLQAAKDAEQQQLQAASGMPGVPPALPPPKKEGNPFHQEKGAVDEVSEEMKGITEKMDLMGEESGGDGVANQQQTAQEQAVQNHAARARLHSAVQFAVKEWRRRKDTTRNLEPESTPPSLNVDSTVEPSELELQRDLLEFSRWLTGLTENYSPLQPRDARGRWSGGGWSLTSFIGGLFGPAPYTGPPPPMVNTLADLEKRLAENENYQKYIKELDAKDSRKWEGLAKGAGIPVEQYKKDVAAKAQKLVDEHHVVVRVPEGTLPLILQSGRWKTQHEVRSSSGNYAPKLRGISEDRGMGVPQTKLTVDRAPVYGYLSRGFDHGRAEASAARYGEVMVKMKDSVKDRATTTMGDSLQQISNQYSAATPLRRVNHRSVDVDDLIMNPKHFDSSKAYHAHKIPGKSFIEVQVHDGIKVKDIAEVGFKSTPSLAIQQALKEQGIPWRLY